MSGEAREELPPDATDPRTATRVNVLAFALMRDLAAMARLKGPDQEHPSIDRRQLASWFRTKFEKAPEQFDENLALIEAMSVQNGGVQFLANVLRCFLPPDPSFDADLFCSRLFRGVIASAYPVKHTPTAH